MTAHQLDKSDSLLAGNGLSIGTINRIDCLMNGSVEPKGLVNYWDIIVDRLGNASNGDVYFLLLHELVERLNSLVSAISSNYIQQVYPSFLELSDYLEANFLFSLVASSTWSQDCPAFVMNIGNDFRVEFDPVIRVFIEPAISVLDSINLSATIVVPQTHDNFTDHDIETRTESSTRHNSCFGSFRIEEQLLTRSCSHISRGIRNLFDWSVLLVAKHKRTIFDEGILNDKARSGLDTRTDGARLKDQRWVIRSFFIVNPVREMRHLY